jgi:pteridine reductase
MSSPTGNSPKVALITGAAKRVGRHVAIHLARRGYDIAFTYHTSEADARSLETELHSLGRHSLPIQADLRDPAAAFHITQLFRQHFSRLDLLLHNASAFPKVGLADTTAELIDDLTRLQLTTPLLLTQQLEPLLQASRGCIISMTDIAADRPYSAYLAYSASKAALQNLTLGLAKTLAPHIRVNAIAPGAVDFPDDLSPAAREAYLKKVPLARVGTPDDVANAVWFLAEEAPYITGQILKLDGGRSIS